MNQDTFKRHLRHFQTSEESKLWYHLRDRRFHGCKFRRQVEISGYIADFVCYDKKLVIELDGGQHNDAVAREYDRHRTECFGKEGFKVVRFWNHDVNRNLTDVLECIWREVGGD
jgi:very-short-patch-repair endonuclease